MQMGVVGHRGSPCVEHREESDLRAQMLGIGRDGAQCLAGRPEQNIVDDVLILKGNGCDWLRHSEDHMEILGVENSDRRSSNHWARASDWHFGQWRSRHEL